MNKPNFFIAGAPKCGTTAMAEYLRRHPNIFMSLPKEPHYFAEDFPKIRSIQTLEQYMELFNQVTPKHLVVGEASTTYLYSSVALKNIYQFNRDAKILVMLRNPVDLVYSLHSHHLYNGFEEQKNFKTAWEMQDLRRNGVSIPKTCREPAKLQYKQIAQLGLQIERLLEIFPPQQVKIILFDDFLASPKAVYEDILSFVDVPSDGRLEFPKINESKTYKLEWLGKSAINIRYFYRNSPFFYQTIKFKKILGLEGVRVWEKILRNNIKENKKKPIDQDFRSELVNEFRQDIGKLSHILGKDLSHWMI